MLHITCWLWSQNGYRKRFTAQHVNTLRNMVRRHLSLPHEFVCITDTPKGIDPAIRILRLPEVPAVTWPASRPNCFRRLWAFSDAARHLIGERIVCMDLDCVVTGSLDPLFDRPDPFVIWKDAMHRNQYNGGFWLLTTGARRQVWDRFRGQASLRELRAKQGSDQAWISAVLGDREPTWTAKDGVYSFRKEVRPAAGLPEGARVVFFHGKPDPWETSLDWVREHYR